MQYICKSVSQERLAIKVELKFVDKNGFDLSVSTDALIASGSVVNIIDEDFVLQQHLPKKKMETDKGEIVYETSCKMKVIGTDHQEFITFDTIKGNSQHPIILGRDCVIV